MATDSASEDAPMRLTRDNARRVAALLASVGELRDSRLPLVRVAMQRVESMLRSLSDELDIEAVK